MFEHQLIASNNKKVNNIIEFAKIYKMSLFTSSFETPFNELRCELKKFEVDQIQQKKIEVYFEIKQRE